MSILTNLNLPKKINFFLTVEEFHFDSNALLALALSFPENMWTKLTNYEDKSADNYWLEVRGKTVGSHEKVQLLLDRFVPKIDPGHVAFHKLPAGMGMPIHIDITTTEHPPRKSVLIFPLTHPCPGTRFYEKDQMHLAPFYTKPVIIRADFPHNVINDQIFDRITLQISFEQTIEEMKVLMADQLLIKQLVTK